MAHMTFRCHVEIERAKSFSRYKGAIRHTASETRVFWTKKQATYGRMNAIGAHQHPSGNADAIFELCLDVLAMIGKVDQTMSDMQPLRW